ncbi:MAG: hypothetical protein JOZ53_17465, partial [Planctomycetaceae bacterium]|nr:hypothetical protein [Planctomycetaceae bacterium]
MTRIVAIVASGIVLAGVPARGEPSALLVSFDALQERLDAPDLRLLDAR